MRFEIDAIDDDVELAVARGQFRMRLAMDEMPMVPLYHKTNIYGVSERVVWQPRLDGRLFVREPAARAALLAELEAAVATHRRAGAARAALRGLFEA